MVGTLSKPESPGELIPESRSDMLVVGRANHKSGSLDSWSTGTGAERTPGLGSGQGSPLPGLSSCLQEVVDDVINNAWLHVMVIAALTVTRPTISLPALLPVLDLTLTSQQRQLCHCSCHLRALKLPMSGRPPACLVDD